MSGFRKHGRKLVRCAVRLIHSDLGEVVTETRDISETGVFVNCRDLVHLVAIGDIFDAKLYSEDEQKTESVSEASLTVVRLTEDGVGLAFN